MFRWLVALALALPTPLLAAARTQVTLLLSADAARPGDTVWAGLDMRLPAGWHTYWRNGGDAGQPTTIAWTLPPGVTAGDIQWPAPRKLVDKISDTVLVTYIYSNEVVLLVPLKLDASLKPGPLEIDAQAAWQECADICVLGKRDLSAELAIGPSPKDSASAALLEGWRKKLPAASSGPRVNIHWENDAVKSRPLIFDGPDDAAPADFYPYESTNFDVGGVTDTLPGAGVHLRKTVTLGDNAAWPQRIAGLFVEKIGTPAELAVAIDEPIGPPPAKPPAVLAPQPPAALIPMLALAFLGGLILNIMPCVLPVIALKILGLVQQSKEHPGRAPLLGLVYGAGVLASFLALAGLAIGVQRAGGVANWGDAVRNPQVQIGLTILMTLIALNLFGVFEVTLGSRTLGAAAGLASRQGFAGAFFNGVLATLLATPCTAPFLGAAMAFAFSQPPTTIVAVFLAAGFGLACPYVLLCMRPQWLRFLPKPGAWMEKFKVAMGFPMLGTAVWLLWVSAREPDDVLWLGLFLVILALAAWVWGEFVQRGARQRGLAAAICAALLVAGYWVILEKQLDWRRPIGAAREGIVWQVWSPEAVDQARREGHPALVDFTAKSCLNCKVNAITSIDIAPVRAKLKAINAVAFQADYTHEDPAIAKELQKFGRPGVPLVLVYSPNASQAPQVLPTILTPSIVLDALGKATL